MLVFSIHMIVLSFFCHYSIIFSLRDVSTQFLCCTQALPVMSPFVVSPSTFPDVPVMSHFVVSPSTSSDVPFCGVPKHFPWCLLLWYPQALPVMSPIVVFPSTSFGVSMVSPFEVSPRCLSTSTQSHKHTNTRNESCI